MADDAALSGIGGPGDEAADRYFRIFERANDAIFLIDPARDAILDANDKACRLLEYSRAELLALPISATHPDDVAKMVDFVGSVLRHGSGWTNDLTCVTKFRRPVPVEVSASVFEMGGQTCLLALIRNLSELTREHQRLIEQVSGLQRLADQRSAQLRRSNDRHRVLLEVNNAVVHCLDRTSLFEAISRTLGDVVTFDRASFTLADMSRGVSTVVAIAGKVVESELLLVLPPGTEIPNTGTGFDRVLDQCRPTVIRDLSQEPVGAADRALVEQGIRSVVVAPLLGRRGPIGTVNVGSLRPDHYSHDDGAFLVEVGAQLAMAVENMLAYEEIVRLKSQLEQENSYLREEVEAVLPYQDIVGQSAALAKITQTIEAVAVTDTTVLITGETGTGKELIARAVHNRSPRRARPLVTVNCAALAPGLIESELFGHEKGAYTGAVARRIGRFELADRGTIFLDEIGDLPMDLQAKLLRVLQTGEFERVGGNHTIKVDVRAIAATNRDLGDAMREGRFRPDLYYRLSVFPIAVPPLRERKEDIASLVRHLTMKCGAKMGKRIERISPAAMDTLHAYSWPGNVRELENVIERAVILSRGPQLEIGEWAQPAHQVAPGTGFSTLEDVERRYIRDVLERTSWIVSGEQGAAKLLGLKPTTLEARMKKLGISRRS